MLAPRDEFTIAPPSMKESFECGSENNFMPNIWLPKDVLPGFKERCHKVEQNILRTPALGFGLKEERLSRYHETIGPIMLCNAAYPLNRSRRTS
ncbi:hypothetical protein BDR04DRAFT_1107748 [Suillus decipiens]|nr:hypothetical protein BDR04DRAFT_1107748 [Suillus decipiens]